MFLQLLKTLRCKKSPEKIEPCSMAVIWVRGNIVVVGKKTSSLRSMPFDCHQKNDEWAGDGIGKTATHKIQHVLNFSPSNVFKLNFHIDREQFPHSVDIAAKRNVRLIYIYRLWAPVHDRQQNRGETGKTHKFGRLASQRDDDERLEIVFMRILAHKNNRLLLDVF